MTALPPERTWRERTPRQPAVLVGIAVAAGIVADRLLNVPWTAWLMFAAALLVGWLVCFCSRRMQTGAVLLLLACLAAGGARHHQFWSVLPANDVSQFAAEERRLVRLRGIVHEHPSIRRADAEAWQSAIPQVDQTHCLVTAKSIETDSGTVAVSGRLRLTISGHLLHADAGDEIEVIGWLSRPLPPGNPGQFDFADYLRRQQCRCVLFANHPDAVTNLRTGSAYRLTRTLARFRDEGVQLCVQHLGDENVPLATALLLGDRSRMSDDVRAAFAESGTAHVLAISGLHVGILAALLWLVCRVLNTGPRTTAVFILLGVMLYAVVSGGRPPVSRATVFVAIAVGGFLMNRPAVGMNTLALALIAVLAWNPSDLFDVGTQLSFLAVAGILLADQWRAGEPASDEPSWEVLTERGLVGRTIRALGGWLLRGYVMMIGIWLMATPLTAARFHLVSPIGFVINVLLIPLVFLLMWCGFAFLIVGMLFPVAAAPFALLFDWQLTGLRWAVEAAASLHLGHLYGTGPSPGWVAIYYLLAAGVLYAYVKRRPARRWLQALLVWTVAGLLIGVSPPNRDGLRCTVLDMGHGCSVLVELPNGKTLLYDAGMLTDASRAERMVEGVVWERGITRLDAVVVSHADVDHFNGVQGLLEKVPVGSVMAAQTFLDLEQRSVQELCDALRRERIPVRLLQQGDELPLDENVSISVLHPVGGSPQASDNANSVVLLIEYAGRRILLPADLERDGMTALLAGEGQAVDVLLSPHHGSRAANPKELAAWAEPRWVVVSENEERVLPYLRETYGEKSRVVSTGEYGAVTFEISPDGTLEASAVRKELPLP